MSISACKILKRYWHFEFTVAEVRNVENDTPMTAMIKALIDMTTLFQHTLSCFSLILRSKNGGLAVFIATDRSAVTYTDFHHTNRLAFSFSLIGETRVNPGRQDPGFQRQNPHLFAPISQTDSKCHLRQCTVQHYRFSWTAYSQWIKQLRTEKRNMLMSK